MIRFHTPFETVVMVSPERITHIRPDQDRSERTRVYFGDDYITLRESVEEVARKVLEWQYIMRKGAYTNTQEMAKLRELAGLEEQNHE